MSEIESPAERLARRFHETYEELAPSHGYETREASRKPWSEVPDANKRLMIAVAGRMLHEVHGQVIATMYEESGKVQADNPHDGRTQSGRAWSEAQHRTTTVLRHRLEQESGPWRGGW